MATKTAKVVRFHATGGPEVLRLEELPMPEPGKGELRLRVQAIGLNRAEIMFRTGQYLTSPKFPSLLGYEAAGVVDAVGAEVDTKLIGKKVSTIPSFDMNRYGVYGDMVIVPASCVASYPEKLSPSEAAAIWMQYITAYGALNHFGHMAKNDVVLITAASSSVGIAAIQIAKVEQAVSIVVTRTAKKKAELLKLGANHVIVSEDENISQRVHEITAGKGANIIFDPIAGKGMALLAEAAAKEAIIFSYGNLSNEPTPFPLFAALAKGLTIRGYTLFEIVSDPVMRMLAEKYVVDHLDDGSFQPIIAKTFKLDQIEAAHRYMESNEQIGKIIVTV